MLFRSIMENSTNANKVTKRERFAQLRAIVLDNEELVAFIDHEIELLNKKNSSKGETKAQIENKAIKSNILGVIGTQSMTIGQITKAYNEQYETEFSSNKISALVSQMRDDKSNGTGEIKRTEVKGVAYFTINQ